jgi:hypothetical protein
MKQTMKQAGIKSSKSLTPDSMYIYIKDSMCLSISINLAKGSCSQIAKTKVAGSFLLVPSNNT